MINGGSKYDHLGVKICPKGFPEQAEGVKNSFQSALLFQLRFQCILELVCMCFLNRARKR